MRLSSEWFEVHGDLAKQRQRAFRPGEDFCEVDAGPGSCIGEVVPREPARHIGEGVRVNARRRVADQAMQVAETTGLLHQAVEPGVGDLASAPRCAVGQHRFETEHVLVRAAIDKRTLAGSVGRDHAANRCSRACRNVRSKEQSVRLECSIKLPEYDARLHYCDLRVGIDRNDPVHGAPRVNDQTVGERLPVGAGAPTACDQGERCLKLVVSPGNRSKVVERRRNDNADGLQLIHRIIGPVDDARCGIVLDAPAEASRSQ